VLEDQILKKLKKKSLNKNIRSSFRLKSSSNKSKRKSVLLSVNQILQEKEEDNQMALTELRKENETLFNPILKHLKNILSKKSKQIIQPIPTDKYFLKVFLPLKDKENKSKIIHLKQKELPLIQNIFLKKYELPISHKFPPLTEVTNQFSPKSLSNDKGSRYVKNRIERVMNEEILWKLTNISGIGKILNKIESKIKDKLDKTEKSGGIPFAKKNFLTEFTKDKDYLQNFEIKGKKKLEDEIVGKKFIDKFEYVEEYISKRRANEFVAYIHEKQKSKHVMK
jgi:hypothetical protein